MILLSFLARFSSWNKLSLLHFGNVGNGKIKYLQDRWGKTRLGLRIPKDIAVLSRATFLWTMTIKMYKQIIMIKKLIPLWPQYIYKQFEDNIMHHKYYWKTSCLTHYICFEKENKSYQGHIADIRYFRTDTGYFFYCFLMFIREHSCITTNCALLFVVGFCPSFFYALL